MLEYAANGQYYWPVDEIRGCADQSAKNRKATLEATLKELGVSSPESITEFFEQAVRRLRAGEIRMIFFLEQAPDELKRIVEFLNKQMSLSEVLLVKARIYEKSDLRLMVPRLFGFNEQARTIRRAAIEWRISVGAAGPSGRRSLLTWCIRAPFKFFSKYGWCCGYFSRLLYQGIGKGYRTARKLRRGLASISAISLDAQSARNRYCIGDFGSTGQGRFRSSAKLVNRRAEDQGLRAVSAAA